MENRYKKNLKACKLKNLEKFTLKGDSPVGFDATKSFINFYFFKVKRGMCNLF